MYCKSELNLKVMFLQLTVSPVPSAMVTPVSAMTSMMSSVAAVMIVAMMGRRVGVGLVVICVMVVGLVMCLVVSLAVVLIVVRVVVVVLFVVVMVVVLVVVVVIVVSVVVVVVVVLMMVVVFMRVVVVMTGMVVVVVLVVVVVMVLTGRVVFAVAVALAVCVGLVVVCLGVVTPVIVIRLVVVTPVPVMMVIAGRGLELRVCQLGGDIHSVTNSNTEAVIKALPEAVVQGGEVHEGLTGGALQLRVQPAGVRDEQNLGTIFNWDKWKIFEQPKYENKLHHLPSLVHEVPLATGRQPQAGGARQPGQPASEKTKTGKFREKIRICKLELDAN